MEEKEFLHMEGENCESHYGNQFLQITENKLPHVSAVTTSGYMHEGF